MITSSHSRYALLAAAFLLAPALLSAQGGGRQSGPIQEANRLDSRGRTKEARAIFQQVIDTATNPATRAATQRSMRQRGHATEANRQVAEARRILDSDTTMGKAQERFFPYLTGYVALNLNDLPKAESELTRALAIQGNTSKKLVLPPGA